MSVVRDILGVKQKGDVAPIASVLNSMTTAVPGKKRKSFKAESREVASLRDTMNLIPISPHGGAEGRLRRHWRWVPYRNTARGGHEINLATLSHWDHRGGDESPVSEDYAAVKFNKSIEIPDLESITDLGLLPALMERHSIRSQEDITLLFDLLSKFELRFPIVVDRFNSITGYSLSIPAIKDMFYAVYASVWPGRRCKYSVEQDEERREILQETQMSVALEGADSSTQRKREEKRILAEIKELEEELKQIDDPFFDDILATSSLWPSVNQPTAASSQKKPIGYEHITKNLTGMIGAVPESSSSKSSGAYALMNSFVKQSGVDFSSIRSIPSFCSGVSSTKIAAFFHDVSQLVEKEKALNAFIRKRETDIKALVKNS